MGQSASGEIVVLEAKYSWVEAGHLQIEELYRPVIERVLGRRVIGVEVCRNLRVGARNVTADMAEAIAMAQYGRSVLHWLGTGRVEQSEALRGIDLLRMAA